MRFLDEAKIFIKSGNGGRGAVSFRREKYVEFGGPDGGDGGRGGHVIACVDKSLNTLIDFRYRQHFKARSGGGGAGENRTGKSAPDVLMNLPLGTQILSEDKNLLIADLTDYDQSVILAHGGGGGRGNTAFKSSVNRAPRQYDEGEAGQEMWLWLRLKLLANVGLVGLPNAGKSTFLSAVSAAKPKIADYPFTTLHPQLGVVAVDDDSFVIADIPGLIQGAHQGSGLGTRFLGHVERCQVLLHLVDATAENISADFHTVRRELSLYESDLTEKPFVVALTKCDAIDEKTQNDLRDDLQNELRAALQTSANPAKLHVISAHSGLGITALLRQLKGFVDGA